MNTPDVPATGAGSANAGGPNSEDQGGTGSRAAPRAKALPTRIAPSIRRAAQALRRQAAPRRGLEPGTGIEDSAQGEGATAKQGKPDMKEGKLPSPELDLLIREA